MSQITFSKNMGHLEAGCDHRKILEVSSKGLDYFASVRLLIPEKQSLTVQKLISSSDMPSTRPRSLARQEPRLSRGPSKCELDRAVRYGTIPEARSRGQVHPTRVH